jgi:hypothetical protein
MHRPASRGITRSRNEMTEEASERMATDLPLVRAVDAQTLAAGALECLLGAARETDAGLGWAPVPNGEEIDPTLYHGGAGIVLTLLEAHRHFGDDRYGAALRGARAVAAVVEQERFWSLYSGLSGMAVALRATADQLGEDTLRAAADRALTRVRLAFDGRRLSRWVRAAGRQRRHLTRRAARRRPRAGPALRRPLPAHRP